jgi:hypothetical protein
MRFAFSFIVDQAPIFAYEAWHLAHSLALHCRVPMSDIHVHFTSDTTVDTIEVFRQLGCGVHHLKRFGDGRYCNKIAQWDNMRDVVADHFVFLDTDTICIANLLEQLPIGVVSGKVVDMDNPPLGALDEVFLRAGFATRPPITFVDAKDATTYLGNCNGGMYSLPVQHAEPLFESWKRHALRLLHDIEPLRETGKEGHVDQVAFCLALHETNIPFNHASSNTNYYLHFDGTHRYFLDSCPIALLHYHNNTIDVVGKLRGPFALKPYEALALAAANTQIETHFNNNLFWDFRYAHFLERGSGVGSRGENLEYKRSLLRAQGIERAQSVLDVGCGDLEVIRALHIDGYVGVDTSTESIAIASRTRPDWTFLEAPAADAPRSEFVLCLEVAIHQETREAYLDLIEYLAEKTNKTLIVSGYDEALDHIAGNHMLFFHEPLFETLANTRRFSSVRRIGAHSDVVVYRCDVD